MDPGRQKRRFAKHPHDMNEPHLHQGPNWEDDMTGEPPDPWFPASAALSLKAAPPLASISS